MARIRHLFPGGNTCYGFHSFYEYMVTPEVDYKLILKGGPGVGKSSLMKKIGNKFEQEGFDIEYHWCSSDNDSLDGVVIGNQQICFVDGTAPHMIDPMFPGAVDEIINLGEFWNRDKLKLNRETIIALSQNINRCFNKAYQRLKETSIAFQEWKSYYSDAVEIAVVNRNILGLAEDFLYKTTVSYKKPRHLFAGAITPAGVITKVSSLIDSDYSLFAVQGNPGTGIKKLFEYTLQLSNLRGIYAEVFHNPFYPEDIDIIILPDSKAALIDYSSTIIDYSEHLSSRKYKRLLNFDQFVQKSNIEPYQTFIASAESRIKSGILDAVSFIQTAKKYHDELESYYVESMDFDSIDELGEQLFQDFSTKVKKS